MKISKKMPKPKNNNPRPRKKYILIGIILLLCLALLAFFPSSNDDEKQELPLFSSVENGLEKNGKIVMLPHKIVAPFHLLGQKNAVVFKGKSFPLEIKKTLPQMDIAFFLVPEEFGAPEKKCSKNMPQVGEQVLFDTGDIYKITKIQTEIVVQEKKLKGLFFTVNGGFKKGMSGTAAFSRTNEVMGILISSSENESVFSHIPTRECEEKLDS